MKNTKVILLMGLFSQSKFEIARSLYYENTVEGLKALETAAETVAEMRFVAYELRGHKEEERAGKMFKKIADLQVKNKEESWLNSKNW